MKTKKIISIVLRLLVAVLLLQTLFFKFTGAPESIVIFETLGIEPWGRFGSGIVELIAVILLFIPSTIILGAFIGIGVMLGAIMSHLTVLGIEHEGDGGTLFILGVIVFVSCIGIALIHRSQLSALLHGKGRTS